VIRLLESVNLESTVFKQVIQAQIPFLQTFLQTGKSFPQKQFQQIFTNSQIRFNIIFLKGHTENIQSPYLLTVDLKNIYEEISAHTGGKTVFSTDGLIGFRSIKNHIDRFYNICFLINKNDLGKSLQITIKQKDGRTFHQEFINPAKLEPILSPCQKSKIHINHFQIKNNIANFAIDSISFHPQKQLGLVKIRFELIDKMGKTFFHSERLISCSKNKINVNLNLPKKHKGSFKIKISAGDLYANQMTIFHHEATII